MSADIWSDSLWQSSLGWQPNPLQLGQLRQLYDLVLQGNQHQNLTRITSPAEFWEKHLWDSLRGIWHERWSEPLRALDIGTGAGFPGIPVAIACPAWQITLLDATQRKIAFVQVALQALGLPQAEAVAARAEVQAQRCREHYDLCLTRAVAAAVVCAEYSLPFLRQGGRAILYRGHWSRDEQTELERAVAILGGRIQQVEGFSTPLSQGVRHCITIEKIAPTPARFPRADGIPSHQPLQVGPKRERSGG